MADKDEAPKGRLVVQTTIKLPNHARQMYNWLHHPLEPQAVELFECICTKAEASEIVARIRDQNPELEFPARWTGEDEL